MTKNFRRATVHWTGEGMVFEGRAGEAPPITLDGDSVAGPSPTETLLLSLAACMAIDIRVIVEKSRVTVNGVDIEIEGERAEDPPKRFLSLRMNIRVDGPGEADIAKVERAAQLSQDKYCSVFHTLRSDLDVTISTSLI